jgi:hypothetical protein
MHAWLPFQKANPYAEGEAMPPTSDSLFVTSNVMRRKTKTIVAHPSPVPTERISKRVDRHCTGITRGAWYYRSLRSECNLGLSSLNPLHPHPISAPPPSFLPKILTMSKSFAPKIGVTRQDSSSATHFVELRRSVLQPGCQWISK